MALPIDRPRGAAAVACRPWPTIATTRRRSSPAGSAVWADERTWEVVQRRGRRRGAQVLRAGDAARTRAASRTSATSRSTRSATRSPTSTAAPAAACCTRWATTRSACRPRTTRSRPASTRATRPTRRSPRSSSSSASGASRSTGRASSRTHEPQLLPLDAVDLPAALRAGLAYRKEAAVKWCPERRDRAGQRAGHRRALRALRRRGRGRASSSSGSSASPTTPTACSTTSTRSTGPSTSRRCSATGSGAPRAPRSRSAARSSASTTRSSPRAPTRCSARRSSSWRPSTPTSCGSPPAPGTRRRSRDYVNHALAESVEERGDADKPKTGVFLGPAP